MHFSLLQTWDLKMAKNKYSHLYDLKFSLFFFFLFLPINGMKLACVNLADPIMLLGCRKLEKKYFENIEVCQWLLRPFFKQMCHFDFSSSNFDLLLNKRSNLKTLQCTMGLFYCMFTDQTINWLVQEIIATIIDLENDPFN